MKEKETKQSLLTWESAAIVFVSVGAGYLLGSREVREKIGLRCRAIWNVIKRRNEIWTIQRKAGKILREAYLQGHVRIGEKNG